MTDVNLQNTAQTLNVLEIFARIIESMKNNSSGVADQKQIVDLFRLAEDGNQQARTLCEKLGINRHVVNQVLSGGESELRLDADPKKLYDQLVFEGKKIATPDREKNLLQILDDVFREPEVVKNPFVVPVKLESVTPKEWQEDFKLEEAPKQQNQNGDESQEEEPEEVLDEKECLKQINRGISTFTSLKFF